MRSSENKSPRTLRTIAIFVAALCVVIQSASSQNPDPRGLRIRNIRVEGARPQTVGAVIQYSGLRTGDVLQPNTDAVGKAIRSLMDRGVYSNVDIFITEYNTETTEATLVISVKEYPRVESVSFAGHSEFDDKELEDVVRIMPGSIYSPYEAQRAAQRIREKYLEEGYPSTKVTPVQTPSVEDSGRVDLLFQIDEGPEAEIGNITFTGNSEISADDLRSAMEDVQEKTWFQFWRSSTFKAEALKADIARIEDYYRSQGFIDAEVTDHTVTVDPVTGRTDIVIEVREGEQVFLRSLTITGNTVYPEKAIRRRLDIDVGGPYDQLRLDQNLNGNMEQTDVRSMYMDNGYLTFNGAVQEKRNPSGDSVDVVINVSEGGQSTIRYVTIVGNTKTKDKVIRRELFTRPGDTFSKAAVIRSLRNLAALNYFNPERLVPDIRPVDNTRVDVVYQVEERPSDTFNASIGISAQGLTGVLGVSFTNFSLLEPLTGGGGQILNFNWEFGTYQTTFALGVTEPWLFDDPTSLGASVYYQTRDVGALSSGSDYKLRQIGAALNLGRRLRWPDDYFRADVGINFRRNDITGDAAESIYYQNGTELSLGTTLSRTSIDNPIFPAVGSRFILSNTIAGLGNAEYNKTELKFDFYSTAARVTETSPLVLYLGTEMGYLYDYGDSSNVPPLAFYSMGGTAIGGVNVTPLRGYRDGSIGPTDRGLAVGRLYAKYSTELRFGVSLNPIPIYILAFAEAGNVWGRFAEVDPFDLKRSAGLGMRLTIPGVGLLGFDYGYGFDKDSYGVPGGWQFHFQFGR